MTSVPGPAFRAHLATLDRETATAFVAAVYEARGWTVGDDEGDLLVTPPQADRPRRLVVRLGADGRQAEARTETDDAHLVDAATLHELVTYALPADERTRLCREFLDCDPESFAGSGGTGSGDAATVPTTPDGSEADARNGDGDEATPTDRSAGSLPAAEPVGDEERGIDPAGGKRSTDRPSGAGDESDAASRTDRSPADQPERSEWLGRAAVVGLALSLALGGVVTATGSAGVSVGSPAAVFGGNGTADGEPTPTFPRGVDSTGVRDASALADAHEATLSNRSYRLTITYREFEDGELRGVAHERALVASPDRYRSRVRRLGTLRHDATVVASGSAYANGSTGYVRTADGVRKRTDIRSPLVPASADTVGFVDRTERTVQWYLSANDTRIVGRTERNGTTTYRIDFEGDPWPESRNVTGRARVDEDGLVRELHREYSPTIEPNVRIEVTIRIVPGPVTVTRPAWMAAATDTDDGRTPARVAPAVTTPRPRPAGGWA